MTKHTEASAEVVETETMDKLFLELSQFSQATTAKELRLQSSLLAEQEKVRELEASLANSVNSDWHNEKVVELTAKLIEREDVVQEQNVTIGMQLTKLVANEQAIAELTAKLEAKDAEQEPVGEIQHLLELNDEWAKKLPIGTKLYTTPPLVSAAVAAALRKAAEVVLSHTEAVGNGWLDWITDEPSAVIDDIAAIPHDDTALRELLQKVAVEMRNLCEYGLKDVEELWPYGVSGINAAVNRVLKGE